ncbi:Protein GLB-14 [Aphelenchoides avenae]|nr:Protein GLB-14 [Aphelenchus avenae]
MYRLEILKQTPDIWLADQTPRDEEGVANGFPSTCAKDLSSELGDMDHSKATISLGIEIALQGLQLCETPNEEKSTSRRGSSLGSNGSMSSEETTSGDGGTVNQQTSPEILVEKRPELQSRQSSESTQSIPVLDEYSEKVHAEVARLTREQRTLIQRTFEQMNKRPAKCGMEICFRLFAEYPQYKNIWPQFRQIPDSSLMNSTALRKHAIVYMGGLRAIIDNMDDDEKLNKALRRIAFAHVKWNIHKRHLMHMVEPVLEVVKESAYLDDEVRTAWRTLYDVIANLIEIFRRSEAQRYYRR